MTTLAKRDGDEYAINGQKMWITFAKGADFILTYAKIDPDAELAHRGISGFIVEKPEERSTATDYPVNLSIVDKLGVPIANQLIVDIVRFSERRWEVFGNNIGLFDEIEEDFPSLLVRDVESEASLVSIRSLVETLPANRRFKLSANSPPAGRSIFTTSAP